MSQALLIIDIQNDYFPGGVMELAGSAAAGEQAGRLLAHFRARQLPIVHIQHLALQAGATFLLPGTPGAEINGCVTPLAGETLFQKHFPNSFRETALLAHLRAQQIGELVVAGMMTHMCVDTTVRAAFDLGFACTLAHDACATRELTFADQRVSAANVQTAYLAALGAVFATVSSVTEIIASR